MRQPRCTRNFLHELRPLRRGWRKEGVLKERHSRMETDEQKATACAHWFGKRNGPFAQRCVHGALPKWADSDPDPRLKQELGPLRNDSTFTVDGRRWERPDPTR